MVQPETRQSVEDTIAAYRRANVGRFFLQKHPLAQPAELAKWFEDAGLVRARSWQKFSRDRAPAPKVTTDLTVREVSADDGEKFAAIVCDAFDLGRQAIPWLALICGRKDWQIFMSFEGDQPAGAGALYIMGDCAWTDFGATAPAFRRRGSQAALLAARIDCALNAGCQQIYTCTGEDVEGDPQHSYKNIRKMGFTESYLRENYAPLRQ